MKICVGVNFVSFFLFFLKNALANKLAVELVLVANEVKLVVVHNKYYLLIQRELSATQFEIILVINL